MQQAWALAIMNARFYQFNLENVYLAALPVTLQRFSFEPQFYAGMAQTGVPQTNSVYRGSRRRFPADARSDSRPTVTHTRLDTGRTGRSPP